MSYVVSDKNYLDSPIGCCCVFSNMNTGLPLKIENKKEKCNELHIYYLQGASILMP